MSDPMTNAEVEDVLASIRRLVSDDNRHVAHPAPKPFADAGNTPDRLVLTPSLRVESTVLEPEAEEAKAVDFSEEDTAETAAASEMAGDAVESDYDDQDEFAEQDGIAKDDPDAPDGWDLNLDSEEEDDVDEDHVDDFHLVQTRKPVEPAAHDAEEPEVEVEGDLMWEMRSDHDGLAPEVAPEDIAEDTAESIADDLAEDEAEEAYTAEDQTDEDWSDAAEDYSDSDALEADAADLEAEAEAQESAAPVWTSTRADGLDEDGFENPEGDAGPDDALVPAVARALAADGAADVSVDSPLSAKIAALENLITRQSGDAVEAEAEAVDDLPETAEAPVDATEAAEDFDAPDEGDGQEPSEYTDDPDLASAPTVAAEPEEDFEAPMAEDVAEVLEPVSPVDETPATLASAEADPAPEPAPVAEEADVATDPEPVIADAGHATTLTPEPAPEPMMLQDPVEVPPAAAATELDTDRDVLGGDVDIIDEEALRELVSDIVRQELQGALGERITRNVRKLVRREIHRALAAQDLE